MIATGTISALGLAGIALGSGDARAEVGLSIQQATFTPEDGEVYRPFLVVSGEWSYSKLDAAAAEWGVYLLIDGPAASGDDWQAIGIDDGTASGTSGTGQYALRGAITTHSSWSRSDFQAAGDGSPVTTQIPTAVMFVVRDGSGGILADAEAHATAEVTVEHGGSLMSVTGTGTVDAQLTPGDPTPTVPSGGA